MEQNNTPSNLNDPVWISREEYNRLREAEAAARPQSPQPVVGDSTQTAPAAKTYGGGLKAIDIVLGSAAVLILLALATNWRLVTIFSGPLIVLFLLVGLIGLMTYYSGLKRINTTTATMAEVESNMRKRNIVKWVLITTGIIVGSIAALPLAGIVLIIIFLILGGGDIGS